MTGSGPHITAHALDCWQQRVDPGCDRVEARRRLRRLLDTGRRRPTPRKWTRRTVDPGPGLAFVYSAHYPEVCALVRDRTVVTVLTRAAARQIAADGYLAS